ncbi:MAG: GNAT family N-acyltransferase [Bacteroidota bacterium]
MKRNFLLTNKMMIGFVRLNATLRNYRIKIAETEEELQHAFALRLRIYQKEVLSQTNPYPDQYDQKSVILLVYQGKKAIATMRMVKVKGGCLTTELYQPNLLEKQESKEVVEIGGLAIDKTHRGGLKFVFISLLITSLEWCSRNQVRYWIGISTLRKVEMFRAINPNLVIKEAIRENLLAEELQERRKENDRIQMKGLRPLPFLIDVSQTDYFNGAMFYLRRLLSRSKIRPKFKVKLLRYSFAIARKFQI